MGILVTGVFPVILIAFMAIEPDLFYVYMGWIVVLGFGVTCALFVVARRRVWG